MDIDLGNNCRVDLDAVEEKSAYERFSDECLAELAMRFKPVEAGQRPIKQHLHFCITRKFYTWRWPNIRVVAALEVALFIVLKLRSSCNFWSFIRGMS
jgi:hypothetical protein